MAFGYPVMLDLTGADVLVVGGGAVAARKVAGLVEAGAGVTVVAPMVRDDIIAAVVRRSLRAGRRRRADTRVHLHR